MNIQLGRTKIVRRAYGIDEIALVPGERTVDPGITKTNWEIGGFRFLIFIHVILEIQTLLNTVNCILNNRVQQNWDTQKWYSQSRHNREFVLPARAQ